MRSFLKYLVLGIFLAAASLSYAAGNTEMVKPTPGTAYWTLDQANSTVIFTMNHSSLLDMYGYIPGRAMSGGGEINDTDFTKSKFEVTFKAQALATTFEFPGDPFKGAEGGLDVNKYPEIKFASKKIEKVGDKYKMTGALTMHGVTKDVAVTIDSVSDICLYEGSKYRAFQGSAVINRQDFGINWREPEKLNHPLFSDRIRITMILEVVYPAPQEGPQGGAPQPQQK